jgi:hypothetical protein
MACGSRISAPTGKPAVIELIETGAAVEAFREVRRAGVNWDGTRRCGALDGPKFVVTLDTFKPIQIAYHVPDPERAARGYASRLRLGPVFDQHIPLSKCIYRGASIIRSSSAYGQAGDLMIELITSMTMPSVLRDLFARDAIGLHHIARFVPTCWKRWMRRAAQAATYSRCLHGNGYELPCSMRRANSAI